MKQSNLQICALKKTLIMLDMISKNMMMSSHQKDARRSVLKLLDASKHSIYSINRINLQDLTYITCQYRFQLNPLKPLNIGEVYVKA